MRRYDTRVENGTLFLESDGEDVEIGRMDDVCEMLGETYTLEYDEKAQTVGWLRTDDDGTITFDVRDTIEDMDYDETFVDRMRDESVDQTNEDGYPERTAAFADLMREIWDSKGNVEL